MKDTNDYNRVDEEMTMEEVINLLERIERGYIPDYNYTGSEEDFENYKLHAALEKAEECVKFYNECREHKVENSMTMKEKIEKLAKESDDMPIVYKDKKYLELNINAGLAFEFDDNGELIDIY